MNVVDKITQSHSRTDHPAFRTGDTLRVHFKIREGDKERVQVFEGVCIGRRGRSGVESITVRKTSFGVGVERIFPLASPRIDKIEVAARGIVCRAKLYYLRGRTGKAARIRERIQARPVKGA